MRVEWSFHTCELQIINLDNIFTSYIYPSSAKFFLSHQIGFCCRKYIFYIVERLADMYHRHCYSILALTLYRNTFTHKIFKFISNHLLISPGILGNITDLAALTSRNNFDEFAPPQKFHVVRYLL